MKKRCFILCSLLLCCLSAFAQQNLTFKGYIKDQVTGEGVLGSTIYIEELKTGTSADINGFYSLKLPAGDYTVRYSFVGYEPVIKTINLQGDLTQNIQLQSSDTQLDEVVVSAEADDRNIKEIEMSVEKLEMKAIKKLPAFLGEVDVIKTLITLPGVTTVGEGAAGFNVRGGNIDQNLVLLDQAPIYSSSHLFGFFSVFNSDIVNDLKLYKGGIPARFGGRISSVLDIHQIDGNKEKFSGSGGIGIVSSRLSLEVPLVKNRSSLVVSGRRSYADLFLAFSPDEDLRGNTAYFYDLNAKADYKLNENNTFELSGYYGRDVFSFQGRFGFDWGNTAVSGVWNHLFNDKLVANTALIYTNYDYSLGIPDGNNAFKLRSHILNYQLKSDFSYFHSDAHKFEFGLNNVYYHFKPGKLTPGEENTTFREIALEDEYAVEPAAYFSHEWTINERFSLLYGARYSAFLKVGKGKVYQYDEDLPMSRETVVDTNYYDAGELISSFHGLEPRLAFKMGLDEGSSLKLSYNRMRQYLQLVSNTTTALPTDVWRSAGPYLKPLIGDQIAIGYFRNFRDNSIEASVEGYYKEMENVVDYKDGADLILNEYLESELLEGIGRSYGMEVMIKKTKGKLTGWLSYTLSRSMLKSEGDHPTENINNGEWYRSNWDKPHDLSVVATYQFTKRFSLSANFTYALGRPVTYPDSKYYYEGIAVPNYSSRNQHRIPDYHRLDLSATLDRPKKENRKWESSWSFSVYNVYARKNAYSIFFQQDEEQPNQTNVMRLSILGTIVPAVTYNFNF